MARHAIDMESIRLELNEEGEAIALLVIDIHKKVWRLRVEEISEHEDEESYYCSHAVAVKGDKVLCGNTTGEPIKKSNVNDCQHCSVGMVRRLRDGW